MWIFLLVVLTYCFTVGFTSRYREAAIEAKELRLKDKEGFDEALEKLLQTNVFLQEENNELKNRYYG